MIEMSGVPVTNGSPGLSSISVSSLLPQVTGAYGSVVEGGTSHESTARSLAVLAPLVQTCRWLAMSTDWTTEYSSPSGGIVLKSCTVTELVPTYVHPLPQSTQKATYSWLPAVQGPPEYPLESFTLMIPTNWLRLGFRPTQSSSS